MKIKLYNRDGADLWLEKIKEIFEHESEWRLYVDQKHLYCLQYLRCIGDPNNLEAVDPSGGPMISLGDMFIDGKYKIIKIINPTTFILWEE